MKRTVLSAILIVGLCSTGWAHSHNPIARPSRLPPLPPLPDPTPVSVGTVVGSQVVSPRPIHLRFGSSVVETRQESEPLFISHPGTISFELIGEELGPYGRWIKTDEYGTVWQPDVAVRESDWRPYCHSGQWIWTDGGWYWDSQYSWGWIPFHYGRWAIIGPIGWAWVPGLTWAPAWVQWRYSPSYCGWAPLPPGADFEVGCGFSYQGRHVSFDFNFGLDADDYVFVPCDEFTVGEPCRYAVPCHEAPTIYRNTTVIYKDYRTSNGRTVYTGLPPRAVHPRGAEPPARPIVYQNLSNMQDGGRLSRILESTESPPPAGRTERILNTPSRAAPASPPVKQAAAGNNPVAQPPVTQAAPSDNGRIARILRIGPSSSASASPAGSAVAPAASPGASKATVTAPNRAQPPASPANSSGSRVARVRQMLDERHER